ncbi:MAG TPA: NUDIX hydrolase [Nitrospiria bacterium]|nr:NUDIX hydrolase [Nitrospiria bacterium]
MTYCPRCGRKLSTRRTEEKERPACALESGGCGFIDFGLFTLGVGGIVLNNDPPGPERILLIQRAQEPNRGGWTIPGGFVEMDEAAEAAVVREVGEETGLDCAVVGLVGFRNRVDRESNTSYAVFLLKVSGGKIRTEPTSEIARAGFFGLSELETLERLSPLSRELAQAALTRRMRVLHPVAFPGRGDKSPFTLFI